MAEKKAVENNCALEATAKIFNIMVYDRIIPPCFISWISRNILNKNWQLGVIPFKPIQCNYKIENNGFVDVAYFDCGFNIPNRGYSLGAFKHKHIAKSEHENLHQVIHCLHDAGIAFENMEIEEWFNGYKVDILGEIEKGKKWIVVELGEISDIGKLSLIFDDRVKELWFGDRQRFIFTLSRKPTAPNEKLGDDWKNMSRHIQDYYENHCASSNLSCKHNFEKYYAFGCNEIIRTVSKE